MPRQAKTAQTATHRAFSNQVVKFTKIRDFLGSEQFKVRFPNGETTTLSAKRFDELYVVNK